MSNKSKHQGGYCSICYDCRWVINDDTKTPFYDTTFVDLLPGDELIRCWECNGVDLRPPTAPKPVIRSQGTRYKTH